MINKPVNVQCSVQIVRYGLFRLACVQHGENQENKEISTLLCKYGVLLHEQSACLMASDVFVQVT